MRSKLPWAGLVLVAASAVGSTALGQAAAERNGAASRADAGPAAGAGPVLTRHSVRELIDRHVEAVLRSHLQPCESADRRNVPCFPVSVEAEGPRFSVAEALRRYRSDGRPAPGPPTTSEMLEQLSGAPLSESGSVTTDPGCVLKSVVRMVRGGSNTFYLYRLRDRQGERPLLTDRKLSPDYFAARPGLQYELIGDYSGECAAVAAWRKALRESLSGEGVPVPR